MTNLAFVRHAFHWLHENLLLLIFGAYFCAIFTPGPGAWMAALTFAKTQIFGQPLVFSLPTLLLACFLFNAGIGTKPADVIRLGHHIWPLIAGVIGNALVPLMFVTSLSIISSIAPDPAQIKYIVVGVAIVSAMPIAGSSTAWSQNANGNLALSLGLVLLTTALSPLTTPLILAGANVESLGDDVARLQNVEGGAVRMFLFAWVVLPSLIGLFIRAFVMHQRYDQIAPYVKFGNVFILMMIIYSNASVYLPALAANPDVPYLMMAFGVAALLCGAMFGAGFALSKIFALHRAETAALTFGLGMNNNGCSLVFATTAFPDQPRVVLPIIFYILVQHVAAATADRIISRRR